MLFLHGYLADKRSFAYQYPYFKNKYNLHALDLRGFGENKGMEFPYSLLDYAEEVKTYLKENKIVKPSVIAHSFGARIAIYLSATEPELFDKIVLTGPAGLKPKKSLKKFFKKSAFKLMKRFVKRERLKKFYSPDYLALDPVMKESFKKIVGFHLDDKIKFIKNPTLIICGLKDKDTPLYMAKRLNKGIENSKLLTFKGAGHFCFIDKPFRFNKEVEEFLCSE